MRFGLRKLTLLDYPGHVACTVFTCGCNFRCPFCHNPSLVTGSEDELECSFGDVLEFLEHRGKQLDGVCITGGEPLMHRDSVIFIQAVKALGYKVKLDTNGSFPDRLEELIAETEALIEAEKEKLNLDENVSDYLKLEEIQQVIFEYEEKLSELMQEWEELSLILSQD